MFTEFACSADLRGKLDRSTTSAVLNIAEGNGRFSDTDHAKFLRIAYKAVVQSTSLVDLATINSTADSPRVQEGRDLLRRIAVMLTSLAKVKSHNT